MKTLALIPARAGSRGIPNKNMRIFWGRPLAGWAIKIGKETCDQTYVTTDDPNIGLLASQYGASVVLRPKELAQDDTPMLPVVQHALDTIDDDPDAVVLLQPTQPLRTPKHVWDGLAWLEDEWDSVVSVVPIPDHYSPELAVKVEDGRLLMNFEHKRRQEAAEAYVRDGTFYITRSWAIRKGTLYGRSRAYVMHPSETETIDSMEDWFRAEAKMAKLVA